MTHLKRLAAWWTTATSIHPALLSVAVMSLVVAVLWVTTPPITFNEGFGYDGHEYALMVRGFRGAAPVSVAAPWVYRVGPPWLVAISGLETKTAFLILDLASYVASGVLLVWLARRYGASNGLAIMALLWWAVLPLGVRFSIHYPVLLDAVGFLLVMGLIAAALTHHAWFFAVTLAAAAVTRENLLVMIPFLWLNLLDRGLVRATVTTLLASVPSVVVLAAVIAAPPLRPAHGYETVTLIQDQIRVLVMNTNYEAWRLVLAPMLSLGMFAVLPLWRIRRSLRFLWREPAWGYYVVVTLAVTMAGTDYDRRLFLLVPALIPLTVGSAMGWRSAPRWLWVALTVLHVIASRVLVPLASDEASYLEYGLDTMHPRRLATIALLLTPVFALAFGALVAARRAVGAKSRGAAAR